ncbi:MAG: Formyltransferase/hydrolase complex subunit D [Alphaproteobacteria bacterium MarineAlpha6_Bin4]|nr:MAG: Formyltransferase/hydrolase complex subunit D [Alphaproteobacteria bacterium MarineAlpha6_Bin3]PPR38220.1 MAG: Formyltransferase/hydrolase complex subunit D [Alphaproteobacteria bacterium MarineAlpha6_Bin4]|tara:strand:- start:1511 stop:2404 length:894 start_codon:yes stop_codon:yes gene_type:complete
MIINGIKIENTFAEAFPMKVARLIITADSKYWLKQAANSITGFATSVIACGCEAGIEKEIKSSKTPDGRSGIAVLLFAMNSEGLAKQVLRRVGQCILTAPTTACFSGIETNEKINLGDAIRYFGDGFQISKKINDKKIWRIPVMEGEFVIEDKTSIASGIGGGNILIIGDSNQQVLKSAEAAVKEMRKVDNIVLPFPGGIVRSGSKVGSKYKNLIASTNDAYCPTLRGITKTKLSKSNESVLEIVIDGTNEKDIEKAMKQGINIICKKYNKGIKTISAGNYGGKLGPYHFHLRKIMK